MNVSLILAAMDRHIDDVIPKILASLGRSAINILRLQGLLLGVHMRSSTDVLVCSGLAGLGGMNEPNVSGMPSAARLEEVVSLRSHGGLRTNFNSFLGSNFLRSL